MFKVFWLLSIWGDLMLFRAETMLSLYCLLLRLLPVSEPLEILLSFVLVLKDWEKHSCSTWPNYKGLRFWISIHLWYSLDKMVELTNASLNEFFELPGVLPLIETIIMFSSIVIVEYRFEYIELMKVVGMCIFTKSFIGTIIQDDGIRERSNNIFCLSPKLKKLK